MNFIFRILLPATITLAISGNALAVDINAGPIWSNSDAQSKCPAVCSGLTWNGQWVTTKAGKMSACGTTAGADIPVGPIWNNNDAKRKCPTRLAKVTWSGNWATTEPGKMSVCGCTPPASVNK
ncbi:mannan-binding protein [Teredinibacter franksiae]|uniref:mannan-binding protein n=1 Tax=Teredinibacter franksiae TaxID=2761453 RepID=UPI0016245749|nr:mannan-binding protein [Teredinibacter franksiae]